MSARHALGPALERALNSAEAADWPHLDVAARGQLLAYVDLLAHWNRAYNLTAVRAPTQMLDRHVLDSLSAAPLVAGTRLLDVGTGAGLPGLVLAIALPELACTLIDSAGKKTRFCTQAVLELGLGNVEVRRCRLEQMPAEPGFDTVVSRAVGEVAWLWREAAPRLRAGGRLLVMKGRMPSAELEEVTAMGENPQALELRVPGVHEQRHLVVIER